MNANAGPEPTTVDEVLARLRELDGRLDRRDGVRYFNRIYVDVTAQILSTVTTGAAEDPGFLVALDVAFARGYLAAVQSAVAGPRDAPFAWRPLFEARRDTNVAPIQFALAGMNAHINYDLPVQIVATSQARHVELGFGTPQHADFVRLTAVFERAEQEAKQSLLTGLVRRLDRWL